MKAVHSEYKMGVQNEFRRFWILLHRLSNEHSKMRRFSTGNLETLQKEGIREALL